MRHIFESLLTMEGRTWSGSWARPSSTRAKAQLASIVHVQVDVQVEVEVHDEQVAWINDHGAKPREFREMKWKG